MTIGSVAFRRAPTTRPARLCIFDLPLDFQIRLWQSPIRLAQQQCGLNDATCERAPSAVCSISTPLLAFCCDCVIAAMFAVILLAIDRPAELSKSALILWPVESWVRVFLETGLCLRKGLLGSLR